MYIQRWLYSTNAKDIAVLYFIFAIFSGIVGSIMSLIIRLELAAPGNQVLHGNHQLFNVLVVGHALLMIFFLVMPGLVGGFGNQKNVKNNNDINHNIENKKYIESNYNSLLSSQSNNIKYSSLINNNFRSYLAGLIEGDGTISISKNHNPSINIVFNNKDFQLAEYLLEITQCGRISKKKGNYVLWVISDLVGVYTILTLINGYMRTPKYEYLKIIISWMNNYIIKNKDNKDSRVIKILSQIKLIDIEPLDTSELGSNAWLSGLSDADSNFAINYEKKNGKPKRIRLHYRLEMKQNYDLSTNKTLNNLNLSNITSSIEDLNYYNILYKVSKFFNCSLYSRIHESKLGSSSITKSYSSYTVITTNSSSNLRVINYFNNYPLLSSKRLDFEAWASINKFIETNGQSVMPNGSWYFAKSISMDYNKTRTTFNWDHLISHKF